MNKKYLFLSLLLLLTLGASAQRSIPNRDPEKLKHSIFVGISGGLNIPMGILSETQKLGFNGGGGFDIFARHNVSLGVHYAYNHFPHNDVNNFQYKLHEILIDGTFYLKNSWHPNFSLGFGYYGNAAEGLFGLVPGVGIMKKVYGGIYFTAKASLAWITNNTTTFVKINAGLAFRIYSPPVAKKKYN